MATNNSTRTERLTAGADAGLMPLAPAAPAVTAPARTPPSAVNMRAARDAPPPYSCQQTLTLTFFFDGTGNNLDADYWTFEHSNVARLYRAHLLDDDSKGLYSFYLAGIGTLFKDREVNDPGDTLFGKAFGDQGQARLNFAFARLREKVRAAEARAANPTNKICWIKVAAFGFSRGAALARAFCRDLEKMCIQDSKSMTGWRLKNGGHPIGITFLGLFDTVASAGLAPSVNNLERNRYVQALEWTNPALKLARSWLETPELKRLAFGHPGADPAPGIADGHATWANDMRIGRMVRRCVHMMAAHENRNSFPFDSTLYEASPNSFQFPATTTEMIYPGVHTDVGGGYRPGEGGCRAEKGAQLSLITLRAMHQEAIVDVPLVPFSAFLEDDKLDYGLDAEGTPQYAHMLDLVSHYLASARSVQVPGATYGLGGQINQHMKLYYAWRFRAVREANKSANAGIRADQKKRIDDQEKVFKADRAALKKQMQMAGINLSASTANQEALRERLETARDANLRYETPIDPALVLKYEDARRDTEEKQVAYDRLRARAATAANDSELNAAITRYDRMLLEDAKQVIAWQKQDPFLKLRPHYTALIDAYRDEFERGQGLTDPKIVELFDDYVHDSLAGFDIDQTWPSDPRILYVGGDRKLRYASIGRSGAEPAPDSIRGRDDREVA